MTNRIIAIVVAIMLIVFPWNGSASADSRDLTISASFLPAAGEVQLSGVVPSEHEAEVSIKIVYPTGKLYVNQMKSDVEGRFSLSYRLADIVPGQYQVTATVAGGIEPAATVFAIPESAGSSGSSGSAVISPVWTADVAGNRIALTPAWFNGGWRAVLDSDDVQLLDDEELADQATVSLIVDNVPEAQAVTLDFPASIIDKARDSGAGRLRITTQFAELNIDLEAIPHSDPNARIVLITSLVSPEELPETLSDRPVLSFEMTVDGEAITKFESAHPIRISIPYQLAEKENPNTVVVYYLPPNKEPEIMRTGVYDNETGLVSFDTTHFSAFTARNKAASFSDLEAFDWARGSIESLAARGIITGLDQEHYAPGLEVTRAEAVKLLVDGLALGSNKTTAEFSDVAPSDWYSPEASIAAELGIVKGYPDGTFGGNKPITREEMLVLVARALRVSGSPIPSTRGLDTFLFTDADRLSAFASDAAKSLYEAGLIEGDNGKLHPLAHTSRAEAAVLLYRLLKG